MSDSNINEQSVAECFGQMAKNMTRLLLRFEDGREMLSNAMAFDEENSTLNIRVMESISDLAFKPISAHAIGSFGEFKFEIINAVIDSSAGYIQIDLTESIQVLPRRRLSRVSPALIDAPEIFLMSEDGEFEVSVLDITHEGVRIMVQSSEWEFQVSRSKLNPCRISIPGAGEIFASLEVRHHKATDGDRLDSPIEIGCRFHLLTPEGVDSLKHYCLQISQKA